MHTTHRHRRAPLHTSRVPAPTRATRLAHAASHGNTGTRVRAAAARRPVHGYLTRRATWLYAAALCIAVFVIGTSGEPAAAQGAQQQTIYVSALDRDGVPIEGLRPEDVVVREDGVLREVLQVLPADQPIDLTVMVDTSEAARELIPFLRTALPPFLESLTPENSVALIGLAERPTILVPSTSDTSRLRERASGLFATPQSGMTLLDAMVEVSDGIRKRDPVRAAIVAIFTDGVEFTNRYAKDVVKTLVDTRVATHLVTIGRFVDDVEHSERERAFFIAQAPPATGGEHLSMVAPHALEDNLERLSKVLTSQYEVVYVRPDTLIPPDKIEVSSARQGITVRGTPARPRKGA